MKKALAVLYSPKTLIDFTWYYYAHGKEYDWDVLIIPCDNEIKIKDECQKSGLFSNIYCEFTNYDKISRFRQCGMFCLMVLYFLIGKKKNFVKRHFKKKGILLQYSQHLIYSDYCSLDAGLLECLADEIPTSILEDGVDDYLNRTCKFDKKAPKNLNTIIAYIMCKMNYASLNQGDYGTSYITKNARWCDKYTTHPDRMKYTNYKSINILGEKKVFDEDEYIECLQKMYNCDFKRKKVDVVLYTTPLNAFDSDFTGKYAKEVVSYIMEHYSPKSVLIKKHPRDNEMYAFPEGVEVELIEQHIPAELIIDMVDACRQVFMFTTMTIMSYKTYDKMDVIVFKDIKKQNNRYVDVVNECAKALLLEEKNIIEI